MRTWLILVCKENLTRALSSDRQLQEYQRQKTYGAWSQQILQQRLKKSHILWLPRTLQQAAEIDQNIFNRNWGNKHFLVVLVWSFVVCLVWVFFTIKVELLLLKNFNLLEKMENQSIWILKSSQISAKNMTCDWHDIEMPPALSISLN